MSEPTLHRIELRRIRTLDYPIWSVFNQLAKQENTDLEWYGTLERSLSHRVSAGPGVVSMVAFKGRPKDGEEPRSGDVREGWLERAPRILTGKLLEGGHVHIATMDFPHLKVIG